MRALRRHGDGAGQEWVFEANLEFPAALGGRPYLDLLVFRVVPDAVAARTELLTRAADVWSLGYELPTAAGLAAEPGIRLLSSTGPVWRSIAWNTQHPLFDTAEKRRALTLALDRETIAQVIGASLAIPGRSTVTPEHWSFDPDAPAALRYDPETAKQLLAAAGWRDRDGDGVLEDEQGRPFRFTLRTPVGSLASKELAEIVQAQLRRIGVRVHVQLVEVATLIQDAERYMSARGERERRFDAVTYTHNDGVRKALVAAAPSTCGDSNVVVSHSPSSAVEEAGGINRHPSWTTGGRSRMRYMAEHSRSRDLEELGLITSPRAIGTAREGSPAIRSLVPARYLAQDDEVLPVLGPIGSRFGANDVREIGHEQVHAEHLDAHRSLD